MVESLLQRWVCSIKRDFDSLSSDQEERKPPPPMRKPRLLAEQNVVDLYSDG